MSAPDIGALRALNAAAERARCEYEAASMAFGDACRRCLTETFGSAAREYVSGDASLSIRFDDERGKWWAVAAPDVSGDDFVEAHAMTPDVAVYVALEALRLTHPAEADALAAVVPPSPTEPT